MLPLRPLVVGDAFALRDWPLHVTVAPTFVIAGGLVAVAPAATDVLRAQQVLRLSVGPEARFGRAMNVPVSLVEPTAELSRLHSRITQALICGGAQFDDPEFIGDGYRPHITLKGDAPLRAGQGLILHQAAIVDMAPEGERRVRKVVWTAGLT